MSSLQAKVIQVYISAVTVEEALKVKAALLKSEPEGRYAVVSTWHDTPLRAQPDYYEKRARANTNFKEIESADALLLVPDVNGKNSSSLVELGYALALRKGVFLYRYGKWPEPFNLATHSDRVQVATYLGASCGADALANRMNRPTADPTPVPPKAELTQAQKDVLKSLAEHLETAAKAFA